MDVKERRVLLYTKNDILGTKNRPDTA